MAKEYEREIFVRGSIVGHSKILLYDRFDNLNRLSISGNTGKKGFRTLSRSFLGDHSLCIRTRVAGATIGDYVQLITSGVIGLSKAFEFSTYFILATSGTPNLVIFSFRIFDGADKYELGIQYRHTEKKWYYANAAGSYIAIEGADKELAHGQWQRMRFSFNIGLVKYVSLDVNAFSYDLSGYSFKTASWPYGGKYELTIKQTSSEARDCSLYIDSVLLTEK